MKYVLREQLAERIAEPEKIECSLFTTFGFNPNFFENNILPLVFNIEDGSEVRRRLQINDRLISSPCAVFYDSSTQPSGGGNYRYQAKGVHIRGRFFHPKNIIIAGNWQKEPRVFVSASSANLTREAWAGNEEAFAFLWINTKKQQAYEELYKFCEYLRNDTKGEDVEALEKMIRFLKKMPEGNVKYPDYNGELYFSPMMKSKRGFPEFLNLEAVYKRDVLTVYSPYWGENIADLLERFKVNEYVVKPAYMEKLNSYRLDSEQIKQINSFGEKLKVKRASNIKQEQPRFRHAKVYLLYTKSNDKVRLGIGSCNFTEQGLSGANGNIESMIVYNINSREAEELDPETQNLKLEDFNQIKPREEEAPEQPPFYIQLLLDWQKRAYVVDFKWESKKIAETCLLKLPGLKNKVNLLQSTEQVEYRLDDDPKSNRTFHLEYAVQGAEDKQTFQGLIYEINLLYSERDYAPKLNLLDIFDSWRHNDDYWLDRKSTQIERSQNETVDVEVLPEPPEPIGQSTEDVLGYYEIYRGFYDLSKRFDEEGVTQDTVDRFFLNRPDSLFKVVQQLQRTEGSLDLTSKFIMLKECEILHRKVEKTPRLKLDDAFTQLLNTELSKSRREMERALAEKDQKHLKHVVATEALEWLEKEIERGWKR